VGENGPEIRILQEGTKTKEVLQKESGRRLCYICSRCTCMELFQRLVAPLVLKFGIHHGQTGRKGVRGGEEEGWSGGGM
jgi:hypothetical protein